MTKADGAAKVLNRDIGMKVDRYASQNGSQNKVVDFKVDGFELHHGSRSAVLGMKVDVSKLNRGVFDTKEDVCTFQMGVSDVDVDGSKPQNAVLDMKEWV